MAKHGKKYLEAVKLVSSQETFTPQEAVSLAKKASYTKFDETVELHLRMGVDPRHADQQVRGIALLPHGLGRPVRILVFAQGEAVKVAEEAGADYVGGDELIKKIEEGWLDFDVAIGTSDMMSKVGRLGRILGRGEFRLDKTAIIHVPIGKVSFEEEKLLDNLATMVEAVIKAKPSGAKGQFIRSITLTTTMGPGIKLD